MFELCVALVAGSWTETTPQDFMDGWYDPLLYVSRRLQVEGANPADSGAVEFYARFDANRDGYYDLVSADNNGPYVRLWFGSSTGYQSSNVRYFSVTSGGNCDMADLNLDGWPELIHSGYHTGNCRIYWGSQATGGPDPNNYTSLPNGGAEAVFVYDLDEDTYLDIILGGDNDGVLRVYWGSPGGYSPGNVSTRSFPSGLAHNLEVADLNRDGYPDIVLSIYDGGGAVYIIWGDGDRNLNNNQAWSDGIGRGAHGLSLADLNRDGWLDIVATGNDQVRTTRIYWSDNGSFSSANRTNINTNQCYGGSSALDVNRDGWLDLILFRGGLSTMPPLLLCPNIGAPTYFRDDDTVRFGISAGYSGGFAYDFNGDGKTDLFANGYATGSSYVYWGLSSTGSYDSIQSLPVNNDHHGGFRECGNVYDRSPTAWYESGVFSSANLQANATISWIAWDSVQIGTELRMYIRTRWDGSSPWSNWRQVSNGETVSEAPYFPARDIQYRAEFRWVNPAWLPWLERVELRTSPLSAEESASGKGQLRFGSSKGMIWVSWPGSNAEVSLYSADGRRIASKPINNDRAEFKGLRPGVYYLWIENEGDALREKVLVR